MSSQPKTQQAKALVLRTIPKEQLLDMVATGWTQQKIADHIREITGTSLTQYYISKTLTSLGEEYQEARKAQARYHSDRISEIADRVETGTLDPASARISSENRKWLASKLDPSIYGDKVALDVQLTNVAEMHLNAMRDAMRVVSTVAKQDSDKG